MNHTIVAKEFKEKYSETSSMKDLRKFVQEHSLPIKDRSKIGLFQKIKIYLKESSKQTSLIQFYNKKSRNKKQPKKRENICPESKVEFLKTEMVYVKEEYVPFIKSEMILEEEMWNELKKNIIVHL